ncbi:hypothetical protein MVEN_02184500 [Mycena venus]|uniref:Uncharacterized protein n=1 Tax=Mycena venus TaxID=2733690 RepID=A0A8H6X869_9AGAR|nr:hypothetical protein MVEN_02184500 [Mycena venus]
MDPTNPPHAVDGTVDIFHDHDNSVTSSGYPPNTVTPSGYPDPGGYPDYSVTTGGYPDAAYHDNSVVASGFPDSSVAPSGSPVDVAALVAANQQLEQMLTNMRLGYHQEVQAEMQAFRDSVRDDFQAVQAQRDSARTENQALAAQIAATVARLERLEGTPADHDRTPQRTRDPRVRPTPSKTTSSTTTASKAHRAKAQSAAQPSPAASPEPTQKSRRSSAPKDSGSDPSPKPARSSPKASRASAKPPRSSPNPPRSSPDPPRSSPNPPRSSPNTSHSSTKSPSSKAAGGSSSSASSSKNQSGTKDGTKAGTPRKLAEHQMLKGDIDVEAQSFKTTFQTHMRFISGSLDSTQAPPSAAPEVVQQFELRFNGLTVTELKRLGQLGHPVINPSEVKVGISAEDCVRSKNRIVRAFFQLEEGALLHIKAYLAKLGIIKWAVDFNQSPYSMYNTAMRMAAIDTFRFCVAGTYYDFLRPDTRYIKDSGLLVRLYDHFIHRYMYDKWKVEIRTPGGNEINAERNKVSQARIRLHGLRADYLKNAKVPKGLKLLFSVKATSDDESTSTGRPQALACAERSQSANQVIRAVEGLMMQDLLDDGKTRAANNRKRRLVPAFGQRNPGYFQEVPKEMPIQYYDPDWFNNRPPQARAKIAPKLIVVFAPGSTDFFSHRGENALSVEQLTEKYGKTVFDNYDLDFGEADAKAGSKGVVETSDADDEGDGDSIGSKDSDEDTELSDAASMASFISHDHGASDDEQDDDMYGEDDEQADAMSAEEDAGSGEEPNAAEDGSWDGRTQFAEVYDIDMEKEDLAAAIFDDSDESV